MPKWRKWAIVIIESSMALAVTCGSSIYTLTYDHLQPELHVSREVATLGLTLYTLAIGFGPLFVAPLSEFFGRKPICLVSLIMYIVWNIPCAVAPNIATELVGRWFSGMAGSAFLTVSGGVVGDLFAPRDLGPPMLIYTLMSFLGPDIGPILGGFIDQYYHWRWVFWVLMIWSGTILALFVFIPETYAPKILEMEQRAAQKGSDTQEDTRKQKSIFSSILTSCYRPFQLLTLEYMVLCLSLLTAVLLGVQYLLFGAFGYAFTKVYAFKPSGVGLSFLGIGVGAILGAIAFPFWFRLSRIKTARNNGIAEPEFNLFSVAFGAPLLPISLFWFGWTCREDIHWIVPIIASALFGVGGVCIFMGVWSFLVESYPLYAASALGANAFTRLVFAGSFPLFGVQMFENLGIGWASTLLGFVALACVPFPFCFIRYGKAIRERSSFTKGG
ncbi:hypothetical protein M409DRAFT_71474 [Zasmidium cellare ATCC 36951]|uniref:Major facilitator superfamily (MFS) profile domain-containing protein n=1 Tax=Zasmidium cellare ATCC 36951 TaxID=1080233 RepID=A0A6A6BXX1_ZASCE|nr:uncharacterized protein M409DRAFT_71474 [Zasmidium cellare ATCC 36951]KAF2158780.1 hypothetical protein M409DRAFT_71474 [Zasmidium cellare ATCC 36951]